MPDNFHKVTGIKILLRSRLKEEDGNWPHYLGQMQSEIENYISSVSDEAEKQQLLEIYEKAKKMWTCQKCHAFDLQDIASNYIKCGVCTNWYHQSCAQVTVRSL